MYELYCLSLQDLYARLATLMRGVPYDDFFFEVVGCCPDEADIFGIGRQRTRSGLATLDGIIAALTSGRHAADRGAD